MWQDAVFTLGSVLFTLALIPSVRSADKPAVKTSLLTASVLYVFAVVYVTLGLYFTAFTTAATATLWAVLLVQKVRQYA